MSLSRERFEKGSIALRGWRKTNSLLQSLTASRHSLCSMSIFYLRRNRYSKLFLCLHRTACSNHTSRISDYRQVVIDKSPFQVSDVYRPDARQDHVTHCVLLVNRCCTCHVEPQLGYRLYIGKKLCRSWPLHTGSYIIIR